MCMSVRKVQPQLLQILQDGMEEVHMEVLKVEMGLAVELQILG